MVEYEIVIEAICSSSDCGNPQAVQDIANAVYDQVTGNLREAIDNGSLVSSLRAGSSDLSDLIEVATESGDFSDVVIPILALISKWYPAWGGQSNACLNDGNAPYYMKISRGYYESSLDACCERFFSWDIYTCTGASGTVPLPRGFFPNWGGSETKCFNSTETAKTMPDYIRQNSEQWLDDDVQSCCEKHFNWAYSYCISLSGGSPSASATDKWYVNHKEEVCQQDCPEKGGGPCGGLVKPWDTLNETAASCCQEKLSWIASSTCEARSTLMTVDGSSH